MPSSESASEVRKFVAAAQDDMAATQRIESVSGSSAAAADASVPRLYSDDVVELLLLRLTEWLRPEWWWWCRLRCRPLPSLAGSPWTTPLRASMPPLTEKLRHTMKARMAAFS
jgi:hypothetical protein